MEWGDFPRWGELRVRVFRAILTAPAPQSCPCDKHLPCRRPKTSDAPTVAGRPVRLPDRPRGESRRLRMVLSTPRTTTLRQKSAVGASRARGLPRRRRSRSGRAHIPHVRSGAPTLALRQIIAQDHGAVVKRVVGAVEKRHRAAPADIENRLPGTGIGVELMPISPPKLGPSLHPMVEPLPELRSGCDLLRPCVECEGFFLHASRPKTLDENSSSAVTSRGGLIGPLDSNHHVETTGFRTPGPSLPRPQLIHLPVRASHL